MKTQHASLAIHQFQSRLSKDKTKGKFFKRLTSILIQINSIIKNSTNN